MSKYVILTVYTAFNGDVEVSPFETNRKATYDFFLSESINNANIILGPLTTQYDIYVYIDGRRIEHISKRWNK